MIGTGWCTRGTTLFPSAPGGGHSPGHDSVVGGLMPLPLVTVGAPAESTASTRRGFGRRLGRDLPPEMPHPLSPLSGSLSGSFRCTRLRHNRYLDSMKRRWAVSRKCPPLPALLPPRQAVDILSPGLSLRWQRSSAAEQSAHNRRVGGSNPLAATTHMPAQPAGGPTAVL